MRLSTKPDAPIITAGKSIMPEPAPFIIKTAIKIKAITEDAIPIK
jgi:hypothetical protein